MTAAADLPELAEPITGEVCGDHLHLVITLRQPGTPYRGTVAIKFYPGPPPTAPDYVAAGLVEVTTMFVTKEAPG